MDATCAAIGGVVSLVERDVRLQVRASVLLEHDAGSWLRVRARLILKANMTRLHEVLSALEMRLGDVDELTLSRLQVVEVHRLRRWH